MTTSIFSYKEGYVQRPGLIPGTYKTKYIYLDSITGMLVECKSGNYEQINTYNAFVNVVECNIIKKNIMGRY